MFKSNIGYYRNIGVLVFLFTFFVIVCFLPCRPFSGSLVIMSDDVLCHLIATSLQYEGVEEIDIIKEWKTFFSRLVPDTLDIVERLKCFFISIFLKKIFIFLNFLNTDFANYSNSYLIGCHTLYFIASLFILFSIMWSSNNIGIFIKLFFYLMVSVTYIFVLDLDPWGCFLIIVEFSAFFLLSVVLNSVKLNRSYFFSIFSYRYALVVFLLVPLLFIFAIDQEVSAFFINFYKSVGVYSNSDFFGIVVLLYSSTYLISLIVFLLVVVSLYIIIFFIKSHSINAANHYKDGLLFFTGHAKDAVYALVDFFFIKTNPIISKWFRR